MLLKLVGLIDHMIILSHLINIRGKEFFLGDFILKNVNVGLLSGSAD